MLLISSVIWWVCATYFLSILVVVRYLFRQYFGGYALLISSIFWWLCTTYFVNVLVVMRYLFRQYFGGYEALVSSIFFVAMRHLFRPVVLRVVRTALSLLRFKGKCHSKLVLLGFLHGNTYQKAECSEASESR